MIHRRLTLHDAADDAGRSWFTRLCDAVLPGHCLGCAARTGHGIAFCDPCDAELPRLAQGQSQGRVIAAFHYAPPIDRLIREFKFQARLDAGRILAHYLAGAVLSGAEDPPDVILPMPLHPLRLCERGFNQSLELARPLGRILGVPVVHSLARRVRATRAQSTLPGHLRSPNVGAAFIAERGVRGLRVAIVDDVMTTGATIEALTTALHRSGAGAVVAWVVASAV